MRVQLFYMEASFKVEKIQCMLLKKKIQYLVHVGLRSALHSVPLGATKQLNARTIPMNELEAANERD